jgi:aldose 1-epimerase
MSIRISSTLFGRTPAGDPVEKFDLSNNAGMSVSVITYGGIIQSIRLPDRVGKVADVVLGFDGLESYIKEHPYFGCITGRVAGRITGGMLRIGGTEYSLAINNGPNHLHGGLVGLDKRIWKAVTLPDGVSLHYQSPDGEEGYPGNIDIAVTYRLTDASELIIESEVKTDELTPVSLTNHSYFNLAGEGAGSIEDHVLQIFADDFVPTDKDLTLSGRRESVAGQPNDLREPRRLRDVVPNLHLHHGDNYLLRPGGEGGFSMVALLTDPASGRRLEVRTNESNLQLYTGFFLDGTLTGKSGTSYGPHAGLCLECQGYPDGVAHPELGDILVRPGQPQRRFTKYTFSTVD